jgi:hypothetical protein
MNGPFELAEAMLAAFYTMARRLVSSLAQRPDPAGQKAMEGTRRNVAAPLTLMI